MRERPIEDLVDGLVQLGVDAKCTLGTGCPPVEVNSQGLPTGKVGQVLGEGRGTNGVQEWAEGQCAAVGWRWAVGWLWAVVTGWGGAPRGRQCPRWGGRAGKGDKEEGGRGRGATEGRGGASRGTSVLVAAHEELPLA